MVILLLFHHFLHKIRNYLKIANWFFNVLFLVQLILVLRVLRHYKIEIIYLVILIKHLLVIYSIFPWIFDDENKFIFMFLFQFTYLLVIHLCNIQEDSYFILHLSNICLKIICLYLVRVIIFLNLVFFLILPSILII